SIKALRRPVRESMERQASGPLRGILVEMVKIFLRLLFVPVRMFHRAYTPFAPLTRLTVTLFRNFLYRWMLEITLFSDERMHRRDAHCLYLIERHIIISVWTIVRHYLDY